ncbi:hypothetical protein MOVS_05770 [Moraxella ovis]|uniref:Uncharacterized protein n=1 Tax=Moraxella ovis TaxID=29433 RepID=A0ABM6BCU0_9GAMM|nr:hypothetical protein MOVS_05770 [Moraxella ovis]
MMVRDDDYSILYHWDFWQNLKTVGHFHLNISTQISTNHIFLQNLLAKNRYICKLSTVFNMTITHIDLYQIV